MLGLVGGIVQRQIVRAAPLLSRYSRLPTLCLQVTSKNTIYNSITITKPEMSELIIYPQDFILFLKVILVPVIFEVFRILFGTY